MSRVSKKAPEVVVFSDPETVARVKLALDVGCELRVRLEERESRAGFRDSVMCEGRRHVVIIEAVRKAGAR